MDAGDVLGIADQGDGRTDERLVALGDVPFADGGR